VPATAKAYTTVDAVLALYPDADRQRVAALIPIVSQAIDAQVCTDIPDPTPDAVQLAAQFMVIDAHTGTTGGDVISETIGGYSYRLANPQALTNTLMLRRGSGPAAELLDAWLCADVYQLDTNPNKTSHAGLWPIDWWQRDYDNPDGGTL